MLVNGYKSLEEAPKTTKQVNSEKPLNPISTKIVSSTPGRLRLRVAPSDRNNAEIERLADTIQSHPHVDRVRTNIQHGSITIHYDPDRSLDDAIACLQDLGIIFGDIVTGKSEAAAQVSNAVVDLNKRVQQATSGEVDLRFLFPLGLACLSARQLILKGLQLEIIPWYVLAWYAFDSFLKLHSNNQQQSHPKYH